MRGVLWEKEKEGRRRWGAVRGLAVVHPAQIQWGRSSRLTADLYLSRRWVCPRPLSPSPLERRPPRATLCTDRSSRPHRPVSAAPCLTLLAHQTPPLSTPPLAHITSPPYHTCHLHILTPQLPPSSQCHRSTGRGKTRPSHPHAKHRLHRAHITPAQSPQSPISHLRSQRHGRLLSVKVGVVLSS